MSIIGLILNLLLAGLLVAALVLGLRLNRRLKALRESHDGFAKAVRELDAAAHRAEQGLADLRAATDEATDLLADRIEKGRALAARLERQLSQEPARAAPAARAEAPARLAQTPPPAARPSRPETEAEVVQRRFGALLAAAREAHRPEPAPEPPVRRDPIPLRRPSLDDDLFEDTPLMLGARR